MGLSRRDFIKSATASGIALSVTPLLTSLANAGVPSFAARETLPGQGWNPAASGVCRIDGVAKVTGAKLYASDFRAADMPNWPRVTSHAMLIRAADATHVYDGLDLSLLRGASKPSVVVTAADLVRVGVRVPEFYAGDLLCPIGKTPLYLGQPVALLIFEDFDAFDRARLALRDAVVLKFGKETGPVTMPNYGAFRFTRVAGPTPDAPDVYAPVKNGRSCPVGFDSTGRPIWAQAATHGEQIGAELAANDPALLVTDGEFETQSVDPMALEPENGLAWFDARRKNLEVVVSVQSPYEAAGTRRSHFTSHWRRCSSRIVQFGSRTTATSSFNRGSSGTPSRSARGSASIGPAARWSPSPLTMHWMAAASLTFRPMWQPSLPSPRSASTMSRRSM
jgi:hypothetical protein